MTTDREPQPAPPVPEPRAGRDKTLGLDHDRSLRDAFERDKWAGEWNSLPTAVDRVVDAVLDAEVSARLVPPAEAGEWADSHDIIFVTEDLGVGQRGATWRDAPTTWGEAMDYFADPDTWNNQAKKTSAGAAPVGDSEPAS